MVCLSSRTSPLTSTVIFWDRSPLATAVVTWAMLRTWPVRFEAMKLTLSVRSFHVPATPGTAAWPPSLPSVPTSRATRETSSAKEPSWSTIAFTVVPMRANSPFSGWPSMVSAIFWVRSPSATATITRATSVVGRTRSSTSPLTESRARRPSAVRAVEARALGHAALAADDAAEAHELGRELRVALDELVVGGLELAHDALAPRREPMREVARGRRAHRRLQAAQDLVLVARARRWSRSSLTRPCPRWRSCSCCPRLLVRRV